MVVGFADPGMRMLAIAAGTTSAGGADPKPSYSGIQKFTVRYGKQQSAAVCTSPPKYDTSGK